MQHQICFYGKHNVNQLLFSANIMRQCCSCSWSRTHPDHLLESSAAHKCSVAFSQIHSPNIIQPASSLINISLFQISCMLTSFLGDRVASMSIYSEQKGPTVLLRQLNACVLKINHFVRWKKHLLFCRFFLNLV